MTRPPPPPANPTASRLVSPAPRSTVLVLDDVSPRTARSTTPAIAVAHTPGLVVRHSRAAAGTGACLFLTGAKTARLVLTASDLTRAKTAVEFSQAASPQSFTRK